jgi:hypothetical protein
MSEIKLRALSINFIESLISRWDDDFQGLQLKKFIETINTEYQDNLSPYFVQGESGVFIDTDVVNALNNYQPRGGKAEWDKDCSSIIFGTDLNPGLFSYNPEGEKVPINEVQATDLRIWNYLSIFILGKYTINRWGDSRDTVRLFIKSLSNSNISRHSVTRLYWSAKICYDESRDNKLELLNILWKTEDFMTQVTERSTAGMKEQIIYFLDYCSKEENAVLFTEKSAEGYVKFRKLIKLLLADSNVLALPVMNTDEMNMLLDQNFEACE